MGCLDRWGCSAEPDRLSVRSYILPFQAPAGDDGFGLFAGNGGSDAYVGFG